MRLARTRESFTPASGWEYRAASGFAPGAPRCGLDGGANPARNHGAWAAPLGATGPSAAAFRGVGEFNWVPKQDSLQNPAAW